MVSSPADEIAYVKANREAVLTALLVRDPPASRARLLRALHANPYSLLPGWRSELLDTPGLIWGQRHRRCLVNAWVREHGTIW